IAATDVSLFQNIKENTNVPLMADESVITNQDLRTFIEHQSVDYVNIKLMKTSGIHPAFLLYKQAELFWIQFKISSIVTFIIDFITVLIVLYHNIYLLSNI